MLKFFRCPIVAAALLLLAPAVASAQTFPSKDVHFIVGYPPGGGPDVLTRYLADQFKTRTSRSVIVENRSGASGGIAARFVALSPPDGYTILIAGGLSQTPALFKNPPADVVKELTAVATLAQQPMLLVVSNTSSYQTLADLTAAIKAKGAKTNYGTTFPGARVGAALYAAKAGVPATEVQYRGIGDLINELGSGALDFAVVGPGAPRANLRVLAASSATRSPVLPDVPTFKESGFDIDLPGWFGAYVPAATPQPVVDQLNAIFSEIVQTEAAAKFLAGLSYEPFALPAVKSQEFHLSDVKAWYDYARIAKIEPQ